MNTEKNAHPEALQQAEQALAIDIVNAKRALLQAAVEFTVKVDPAFNDRVLSLLDVLIAHAKDSDAFKQGDAETRSRIEAAIEAIKKKSEAVKRPDVAGGDIVGADWIDDVGRFIEAIFKLLTDEKDFFFKIIRLIICGCNDQGGK